MHSKFCSRTALCALLFAAIAPAQNITGRISGTVTDSTGATIQGAVITVTATDTKLKRTVVSDDKGYYLVAGLSVGTFDVEAEAPGFRKAASKGFDLTDAGRITANFKLILGAVTESVVVNEVV